MSIQRKISQFRPWIIGVLAVFVIGGIALYYGNSYAMVKATSAVVLDVPAWFQDRSSAKEYLGYLLAQYLKDTSLPSRVADELGVVIPEEEKITLKVVPSGSGYSSFQVTLTARGYELTSRILESALDSCREKLVREARPFGLRLLKEKETELSFLRKYVERERKLNKSRLSTQSRYEQLTIEVAGLHLKMEALDAVMRYTKPVIAIQPSKNRAGSLFLLLISGSLMIILFLEYVVKHKQRLKIQEKIEKEAGLPVIGMIPHMSSALEVKQHSLSMASEAFRAVRSRLEYRKVKRVALVSWGEGEGTTTIAANLAMVLAEGQRNVTVVDGNMRRPSLHTAFDLSNEVGLSDVLIDTNPLDVEWVAPEHNLRLIVGGPVPPDAGELWEGSRLSYLAQYIEEGDGGHVIMDLPPLCVCGDVFLASSLFEAAVLVVRPGLYSAHRVVSAARMLKRCNLPVAGIIMNDVDSGLGNRQKYSHRL